MSAYGGVGSERWFAMAVVEVCVEVELSEESLREGEDGGEAGFGVLVDNETIFRIDVVISSRDVYGKQMFKIALRIMLTQQNPDEKNKKPIMLVIL